jgi:hypothetical protein
MTFLRCATVAISLLNATFVWGHGVPIDLTVESNRLVVGGGLNDTLGFAPQLFVQPGSTGDPEDVDTFTNFGPAVYWIVPGLDIVGLAENSGLYLDVLARPVKDADPAEQRVLWFWNPDTAVIEQAPDTRLQIRRSATVNSLLTPDLQVAPPSIKFAAPLASDMNFHNHSLLRYLLPNPLPPAGAYAFFARFSSDVYDSSEPFLLLLNNGGLSDSEMSEAALAINAAAVDSLPGDFNLDGIVDAADYTVWRNNDLGPEKYLEWKSHFGQSFGGPGGGGQSTPVPEPAAAALLLVYSTLALAFFRGTTPFSPHLKTATEFRRDRGKTPSIMACKEQRLMPRRFSAILLMVLLCACCGRARHTRAAGVVMNVGVSGGQLVVTGGTPDSNGFADQIFLDTSADGYAQSVNISGFGAAFQWTVPGVHISGMKVNSGLYIEALAVPDSAANPERDRVYWHWSGVTQSLQDAPIDNHFLIYKTFAAQGIYLTSTDMTNSFALKMASPLDDDMNVDNYGTFVKFALHKEVPPPLGVYAVFARFKSDLYAPSEPFLLAFNNGRISPTFLTTGALAINAAAGGGGSGPTNGDFNGDGSVDAADYSVWRDGLGTTYTKDHYDLWKRDFGLTFGGAGGGTAAPEPTLGTMLAAITLLQLPLSRRRP